MWFCGYRISVIHQFSKLIRRVRLPLPAQVNYYETKTRSIVKTIIWRILATLITWGVVYFFIHQLTNSLKITLVAAFLSMLAYYIHERTWNKVKWGKVAK